ncbi:MAG: tRNA pseudouridine(38-40) synthase TruA, partial [Cyclobacteriaceae bacterium]|nr:tRNA pseudouridine(38-40) synthase TruA [Cyclobacteriaceae bacterium]
EKFHPFAAANLAYFPGNPDFKIMQEGASLFLGRHDFRKFCSIDKLTDNYQREIFESAIIPHPRAGTGLVPGNAHIFKVRGDGFLRYQVRMMVSALVELGLGNISLSDMNQALHSEECRPLVRHAPANGLILQDFQFKNL